MYWAAWSEALTEAGFSPNAHPRKVADERICNALIALTRKLGRFPTRAQRQLKRRQDVSFPGGGVLDRIGGTKDLVALVLKHCRKHPGHDDVLEICEPLEHALSERWWKRPGEQFFFVYLFKSGRHYKVGHSAFPTRRCGELAIHLPERLKIIHTIKTDDPFGVEAYWHNRFKHKRTNGEWFALDRDDVRIFKRRTFM